MPDVWFSILVVFLAIEYLNDIPAGQLTVAEMI